VDGCGEEAVASSGSVLPWTPIRTVQLGFSVAEISHCHCQPSAAPQVFSASILRALRCVAAIAFASGKLNTVTDYQKISNLRAVFLHEFQVWISISDEMSL
jgi:hypothetical protein